MDLAFLLVMALATSMTVPVVGALLMFSLMIGPAAAARSLTARPVLAMGLAVAIALVTVWTGIVVSYQTNWPLGFFVGIMGAFFFLAGRGYAAQPAAPEYRGTVNRLKDSTSPYLLQHADNPVDWWPWCDEAFAEAARRDVPVMLSVGYAACHWCHVMAHESFEDPETAALLNEHVVAVKVDREERPDVDAVYMTATQAMTGQGGWPMTVFMTPDQEPFFCGTYFPRDTFRSLVLNVARAWRSQRAGVADQARQVVDALSQNAQATARALRGGEGEWTERFPEIADAAVTGLERNYDAADGGFGGAPKFPPSMVLEFLLRHHRRTGAPAALYMAEGTCEAMARGGLYDQLGGGFARYSTDAAWVVPHFEKMLYDNALLARVYLNLWRATGSDLARRVAEETCAWMLRELRTEEGGLAASLDADSEGEEGKFYVWRPAELDAILGSGDGEFAARVFGVTERGTFEHGASVLQRRIEPEEPDRLARVRAALLAARDGRVRPGRDDKVVAAWNGLAISALAECGLLLGRPDFVAAARDAAALLATVHLAGGRLIRTSRDGAAGDTAGVLEDYACVAEGLLVLSGVTGEARWTALAGDLLETALTAFGDGHGGFYDTADGRRTAVLPPGRARRQRHAIRNLRRGGRAAQLRRADRLGAPPGGRRGGARRAARHRGPVPARGRRRPGGRRGLAGRAVRDRDRRRPRRRADRRAAPDGAARGPARRGPGPWRRDRRGGPAAGRADAGRRGPRRVRLPPVHLPAAGHHPRTAHAGAHRPVLARLDAVAAGTAS